METHENTRWRQRHMYTAWRAPQDDGGREWSYVSPSRGTPRISNQHQKLEEARKTALPQVSEGAWPHWHLNYGLLACRTMRQKSSVFLINPACGTFFLKSPRKLIQILREDEKGKNRKKTRGEHLCPYFSCLGFCPENVGTSSRYMWHQSTGSRWGISEDWKEGYLTDVTDVLHQPWKGLWGNVSPRGLTSQGSPRWLCVIPKTQ